MLDNAGWEAAICSIVTDAHAIFWLLQMLSFTNCIQQRPTPATSSSSTQGRLWLFLHAADVNKNNRSQKPAYLPKELDLLNFRNQKKTKN